MTENQGDFRVKKPGDPKFTQYAFNFTIPISQGASSLVFEIRDNGRTVFETNGGSGFPINTIIFPAIRDGGQAIAPWTCRTRTVFGPSQSSIANLTVHAKVAVSVHRRPFSAPGISLCAAAISNPRMYTHGPG